MSQIAEEILRQLGGREFVIVTDVKNLVADNNTLRMKLPKNQSGANMLEISLDYATDTYSMRFYRYTPPKLNVSHKSQTATFTREKVKDIEAFSYVYCDQLQELFTQVTGFDTRMPRIIGINC